MNCRKQIVMTGYHVQFVDLREPKPRTVYDETYVLDRKFIDSLGVVRINVIDYITEKYAKAGYHVCNVQKAHSKRAAYVDLRQMWEDADSSRSYHVETASGLTVFKAATEAECERYCNRVQMEDGPDFLSIVEDEQNYQYTVYNTKLGLAMFDSKDKESCEQYIAHRVQQGAEPGSLAIVDNKESQNAD